MSAVVIRGDAAHLALPDGSVDAVVTDPPYGLEFMGKDWDAPWRAGINADAGFSPVGFDETGTRLPRPSFTGSTNPHCRNCGGRRRGRRDGTAIWKTCMCEKPDFPNIRAAEMAAFQEWCVTWAAECLRVLRPGGYLLAFGGTRTYHRMACAIEDAGLEIRDSLHWLYGTGFPKGKACLKPAHEPIVLTRKPAPKSAPLPGLDACRIAVADPDYARNASGDRGHDGNRTREMDFAMTAGKAHDSGRWPPNILFGHAEGCEPAGMRVIAGNNRVNPTVQAARVNVAKGTEQERVRGARGHGNADGTETVEAWDCAPGCPVAELDAQSGVRTSGSGDRGTTSRNGLMGSDSNRGRGTRYSRDGDSGGASRFFPQFRHEAKAPASERPRLEDGTAWPTVKPVALMRWLVRLVTPPGGIVLDPFCGTGTTGEAAILEGLNAVLIDRDPVAIALTRVRLAKPMQPDLFGLEAS